MKRIILVFLLYSSMITFSQRFKVLSGDLKSLKEISEYNITFDYSDLVVHGYESEEEYLAEKVGKRSSEELKAEKFKEDWYLDRVNKYEPSFISYFNERFKNGEMKVEKNETLQFTIGVKTTWVYPGYTLAAVEPAKISAILTFFETQKPENILFQIEYNKVIGISKELTYDQGNRIAGAYEKLAKNIVMQLKRL